MLLFLPALAGLLLVASFPQASQGYLTWVAFVPLIVFVFKCRTTAEAFGGGLLAGAIELFFLLIWIPPVLVRYGSLSSPLAWISYTLIISLLACFPAAACALAKHMVRRGDHFIWLFPVVWVAFEYAQNYFPFRGFPWLLAGYSQADYLHLIQIADVTGIYGISFLIIGINTAIAWIALCRNRGLALYGPLFSAVALMGASLLYGEVSLRRWEHRNPSLRAAMLQQNLSADEPMQMLIDKSRQGYQRMANSLKLSKIDLLVLPETPSVLLYQYDADYRQNLESLARRYPMGLIFNNSNDREIGGEQRYLNSAYFLDGHGRLAGIYEKIHLVPFGEYIPLRSVFFFIKTVSQDVGDFLPGSEYRIVEVGGHPSNAIICFEAIFPALVREFVEKGSQLMVNLTNDGWYGISSAPYQHLAIARLRAVENRRYMLRATNSGISAIIEPSGRVQSSTGLLHEAICEGRFEFLAEKSLYTRYGDVFAFLCAIISCGSLILWGRPEKAHPSGLKPGRSSSK